MGTKPDRKALCRHWVHSREEDTPTEVVYRPASYVFPPARGRKGFELKSNGSMTDLGIGPSDRHQAKPGTWSLDGDTLTLEAASRRVVRVLFVGEDKLVLRD